MTMWRFMLFLLLVVTTPASGDTASLARAHGEAFARAMDSQDVDSALAFYAEDAQVIWPGIGDEAHGKIAIRALIDSTLKSFPKDSHLTLKSQEATALGDGYIATVSHWEQSYTQGDGTKATAQVRATEIIRVTEHGSFYVSDHASFGRSEDGAGSVVEASPVRASRRFTFIECDKYQDGISANTITPGDIPGHEYSLGVWRHNYTTTDPEYGEAKTTIFLVSDDVLGAGTNFGTAVDMLASGESIFWQFRGTQKTDPIDGASMFEGTGVIVGGTGKYKNARGREVYRGKATAAGCKTEGDAEWDY
jgi:uncharacterized protein (TIGR02246 family)